MRTDVLTARIEFARSAEKRREEVRFHRDAERRREAKEVKDRAQDIETDLGDIALGAILATDTQIAEFAVHLDTYDEATVKALLQNEQWLDVAREKLEALRGKGHLLPDGRRVFKTQSGFQVFDEFGVELDASIIHPNEIPDTNPRWEEFVEARNNVLRLEAERTEILDFQQRTDEARERLDGDGLTADDLDEMKDALEADMPLSVREQMPDFAPSRTIEMKVDFAGAAELVAKPDRSPVPALDY